MIVMAMRVEPIHRTVFFGSKRCQWLVTIVHPLYDAFHTNRMLPRYQHLELIR